MSRLVVIGDCLLDRDVEGHVERVMPDGPAPVLDEDVVHARAGGAGLAATLAARDGHEVVLVTALSDDDEAAVLRSLLHEARVDVVAARLTAPTPVKTRLRAAGQALLRLDHGGRTDASHVVDVPSELPALLAAADAVLVSCYGRGITAHADVRAAVAAAVRRRPVVWDPHPSGAVPLPGTTIVTPNAGELAGLVPEESGGGLAADTRRARRLAARWQVGVAATRGSDGALHTAGEDMALVVPAPSVERGDVCGAGDRFASAVAGALADRAAISDAVRAGVESASAFVARGGAAAMATDPAPVAPCFAPAPVDDAFALADRVRDRGGTVVATGGCFDILHLGHADLLQAARSLGDCLVVCLNSDASVRRLKGPDRPVVPQADRAALLSALASVDAVLVFDEDTPAEVLRRLRPDVFVKGGDYAGQRIIEAQVMADWGGQAVTVPYRRERSTTRLLQEVRSRD